MNKNNIARLWGAVQAEFRTLYAGSLLGVLWFLLAPLLQVGMYVFLFQVVWKLRVNLHHGGDVSFVWFLLSAYIPYWAFQDALSRAAGALTANAHIIRNTPFPPWLLVVARVMLPFGVMLALVMPLWPMLHQAGHFQLQWADGPWLAFTLMCLAGMAVGLAVLLASVGVVLRDLANIVPPLLMALMLTAPIMYPLQNVPEAMRGWFWLNPLTPFAEAFHTLLLTPQGLDLGHALAMPALALGALWLGRWAYRKMAPDLPDLL